MTPPHLCLGSLSNTYRSHQHSCSLLPHIHETVRQWTITFSPLPCVLRRMTIHSSTIKPFQLTRVSHARRSTHQLALLMLGQHALLSCLFSSCTRGRLTEHNCQLPLTRLTRVVAPCRMGDNNIFIVYNHSGCFSQDMPKRYINGQRVVASEEFDIDLLSFSHLAYSLKNYAIVRGVFIQDVNGGNFVYVDDDKSLLKY